MLQAADHIPQTALLTRIAARVPNDSFVDLIQLLKRRPVPRLIFRLPLTTQFWVVSPWHQNIRPRGTVGHVTDIALRIVI